MHTRTRILKIVIYLYSDILYIQQYATLHSLFISRKYSTCFGWYLTHHQEHTQLYLQHLALVKPLLPPAAIVEELELCIF